MHVSDITFQTLIGFNGFLMISSNQSNCEKSTRLQEVKVTMKTIVIINKVKAQYHAVEFGTNPRQLKDNTINACFVWKIYSLSQHA